MNGFLLNKKLWGVCSGNFNQKNGKTSGLEAYYCVFYMHTTESIWYYCDWKGLFTVLALLCSVYWCSFIMMLLLLISLIDDWLISFINSWHLLLNYNDACLDCVWERYNEWLLIPLALIYFVDSFNFMGSSVPKLVCACCHQTKKRHFSCVCLWVAPWFCGKTDKRHYAWKP